jgi:hypothetical protein
MAGYRSEIIYTPPMMANWAKVLGKAQARSEGDEPMWSIDLLGDPNDEEIEKLRTKIRGFMVEAHGAKPKVSANGMPLKRHEEKNDHGEKEPTGMLVLKAKRKLINKAQGLENAGPTVLDSQCNKWPEGELIGNGSTVIAKIHFWGWSRAGEGVGLSCELHALQVVKHVPYSREQPADAGFGVVPGGAVAPITDPEAAEFSQQLTAAAQAAEEELPF